MASQVPIDDVVVFDVVTHSPSTGAVTDADSGPTYDVFEETTDTAILSAQTLTKRTSMTGNYRGNFTASAANGFEAGKWYSVIASATVGTVAGKTVAMHFRVAPAETAAGVPKVDASHVAGTSQTAGDIIADTNDIQARLPAALVSGRMDASVGAYQSGLAPLQPTTAGRTLDVTATGAAGIDWGNVENPNTAVTLGQTIVNNVTTVDTVTLLNQIALTAAQDIGAATWANATRELTGVAAANVTQWNGSAVATPTVAGVPEVDVTHVGGVAASGSGTVDANVVSISGDTTAADNAEAFFDGTGYAGTNNVIPTVTAVTNAVTITGDAATAGTRFLTMIELDGAVYRYTTNALEQGPAGGGGGTSDWTADQRTAIATILGIPASGTTPEVPTAGALKVIDDLIDTEIGTIVTHLTDIKGATFSGATDSLEAIRDRGDAAWVTATGFSTHSAADVWAVGTRTVTGGTIGTITGLTIANVESMATRFLGMIELDGAVYRYTANALEQGPEGEGGGGGTPSTLQDGGGDTLTSSDTER